MKDEMLKLAVPFIICSQPCELMSHVEQDSGSDMMLLTVSLTEGQGEVRNSRTHTSTYAQLLPADLSCCGRAE